MGVVYYGNYYRFFEFGRNEFLRNIGLEYKYMEEQGIFLPVKKSWAEYFSPIYYDDLIEIKTILKSCKGAKLEIESLILRESVLLAKGGTIHYFINKDFKVIKPPRWIKEKLSC
jgi:acyl-CoA thioester hydrolase